MQNTGQIGVLLTTLLLLLSCQSQETQQRGNYEIVWDESSLVCIADEGAYPRLRRLDDGMLLVAFENRRGDVLIRKSGDEGATWSEPVTVFEAFEFEDNDSGESTR